MLKGFDPMLSAPGGKQEPKSNVKRSSRNGVTAVWLSQEQAASRKPHGGRIVSEANAWGNAQDRLTETRSLGWLSRESQWRCHEPGTAQV